MRKLTIEQKQKNPAKNFPTQNEPASEKAALRAARQGDDAALAYLFSAYEGLLAKAARQRHLAPLGDDAQEAARVSFWDAVISYDPTRGVPFPGWAKAKVYGDLWTLFKQARRRWNREILPGNDDEGAGFTARLSAPDAALERIADDDAFLALLRPLTPRAQKLLHLLYQEGLTQREAAVRLGISQQAASAMQKRALKKLRETLSPCRSRDNP